MRKTSLLLIAGLTGFSHFALGAWASEAEYTYVNPQANITSIAVDRVADIGGTLYINKAIFDGLGAGDNANQKAILVTLNYDGSSEKGNGFKALAVTVKKAVTGGVETVLYNKAADAIHSAANQGLGVTSAFLEGSGTTSTFQLKIPTANPDGVYTFTVGTHEKVVTIDTTPPMITDREGFAGDSAGAITEQLSADNTSTSKRYVKYTFTFSEPLTVTGDNYFQVQEQVADGGVFGGLVSGTATAGDASAYGTRVIVVTIDHGDGANHYTKTAGNKIRIQLDNAKVTDVAGNPFTPTPSN